MLCVDPSMYRYDCVWAVQPDAFSAQLEELRHLELELGHLPQKWTVHWDKLEIPPPEQLTVCQSCNSNFLQSDILLEIFISL